jgi:two-component system CitB family sensor kinase
VTVTVRTDPGELFLRVADSGPGVDTEAATEMFRKGWSTKPSTGPLGRGLGLALVGQAVRRYGGRIEVGHDEGAVFTVRLPTPAGEKEDR